MNHLAVCHKTKVRNAYHLGKTKWGPLAKMSRYSFAGGFHKMCHQVLMLGIMYHCLSPPVHVIKHFYILFQLNQLAMELVESWILELKQWLPVAIQLQTGLTGWSHTVFKLQLVIMQSFWSMHHEEGYNVWTSHLIIEVFILATWPFEQTTNWV